MLFKKFSSLSLHFIQGFIIFVWKKKNGRSIKHESMEQNESGHLDLKEYICLFLPRSAEYESLEPSLKLNYHHFSKAGGCLAFTMRRI